jgi:hypothetical protein
MIKPKVLFSKTIVPIPHSLQHHTFSQTKPNQTSPHPTNTATQPVSQHGINKSLTYPARLTYNTLVLNFPKKKQSELTLLYV